MDGGFLTPYESKIDLSTRIKTNDILEINPEINIVFNKTTGEKYDLKPLGEVAEIVEAGGIFEYARINGMV